MEDAADEFGRGPFPAELRHFSWGAFLLPGWWALVHRLGAVWLVRIALFLFPVVIRWKSPQLGVPGTMALFVAAFAIDRAFALWFGMKGNQLAWDDRSLFIAAREERHRPAWRKGTAQFLRNERVWAVVGFACLAYGLLRALVERASLFSWLRPAESTLLSSAWLVIQGGAVLGAVALGAVWRRRARLTAS